MTSNSPNVTLSETEVEGMLVNYESQLDVKYRGAASKFIAAKILLRIWLKSTERNFMNAGQLKLFEATKKLIDG
jgi:hypothetical protein